MHILEFFSLPIEVQCNRMRPALVILDSDFSKLPELLELDMDGYSIEPKGGFDMFKLVKDNISVSMCYGTYISDDYKAINNGNFDYLMITPIGISFAKHIKEWDVNKPVTKSYFMRNFWNLYISNVYGELSMKDNIIKTFEIENRLIELAQIHCDELINLKKTYRKISNRINERYMPTLSETLTLMYVLTEAFPNEEITVEDTIIIMLDKFYTFDRAITMTPETLRNDISYREFVDDYRKRLPAYPMYPYLFKAYTEYQDRKKKLRLDMTEEFNLEYFDLDDIDYYPDPKVYGF